MRHHRARSITITALVALAMLAVTILLAWSSRQSHQQDAVQAATLELDATRAQLEQGIFSGMSITRGMMAFIATNPDFTDQEFELLAQDMTVLLPYVKNVGLAENNVVSHIYPVGKNRAVLGLDYNSVESSRVAVALAQSTRKTIVLGPIDLIEGGTGIILRTPVFLSPGNDIPGSGPYWGMTSVVIDMPLLLEHAGLDYRNSSAHYLLTGTRGTGEREMALWGDENILRSDHVSLKVGLPTGSWRLVARVQLATPLHTYLILLCGCLLTALFSAVLYLALLSHQRYRHSAYHDNLTGLPNRRFFLLKLTESIARHARNKSPQLAVMFLDMDGFKLINDSLGHLQGDEFLRVIARRLQSILRRGDVVARLGGDEFCILMENVQSVGDATELAERIQEVVARPIQLNDETVTTSASIGVVLSNSGLERAEDYLRDADSAMYKAKGAGKARYALYDADLLEDAKARLKHEHEFRQGLKGREFDTWYQPILDVASGHIVAVEALARWNHPQQGWLTPASFLSLAEDLHLMNALDRQLIMRSLAGLAELQQLHGYANLKLNFNVCARSLAYPGLQAEVQEMMNISDVSPAHVNLEITENALFEHPERLSQVLNQLQSLGVQHYLDDFGTGYSSLNHLHQFPIHGLKIDRSFVARLGQGHKADTLVESIIAMAQRLELDITAEGVETAEQANRLKQLGVKKLQGYHLGRPMPLGDIAAYLDRHARELSWKESKKASLELAFSRQ